MPKFKRSSGLHRARTRKRVAVVQAEGDENVIEPASPRANEENAIDPGSPINVGELKTPVKVHTPVHTPSRLLAAHVLAFELPTAKVATPVVQVTPPSPTVLSSDPRHTTTNHSIMVTPSKLASKFVVSETIPSKPSQMATKFVASETKRAPARNLAEFLSNFAPTPEKSPVQSCPERQSPPKVQPSTSVSTVKVTPQKLCSKFTVTPLRNAQHANENISSFFSNFVPSPITEVAMVTPSKVCQEVPDCTSDTMILSDDFTPLDWNQDSERDQEGNISVVTHNTRRKVTKVLSNPSASPQLIEPAFVDALVGPMPEQETTEQDMVSQMMSKVSLQNESAMESSPTKSHKSAKTAHNDFLLISEDGYGSEEANFDSGSEKEEEEDAHEGNAQENSGRKAGNSQKVCTCKCTCGAPPKSSKEPKGRPLSYELILKKPEKEFRRLTGLSRHNFLVVYEFVGGDDMFQQLKYQYNPNTPNKRMKKQRPDRLTNYDRLFLTLMRLRRGFSIDDLALFFDVSSTLISDVFFAVVQLLNLQFQPLREHMFTTRAAQPMSVLPACLKPFKNFRATIDTTEVKIQVPYHYQQQGNTHSTYKSANVVNYLVACNCWGAVSFISPGFEGSISDIELFRVSGICDMLHPGDLLLADKGFTVQEQADAVRATVVHPAFRTDNRVFTPEEDLMNRKISAGRIHIERCIRKLKCFHILKRITNNMLPNLDHIVFVIACLVNFDPPNIQSMQEDD